MQIELIGCTSSGKSTLARGIFQAGREHGAEISMGDETVLKHFRLSWVKPKFARILCVDLIALFGCFISWKANLEFYRFGIRIVSRLQAGRFEKLNIARNVLKNIGIHEIIRRVVNQQQLVLLDEGPLHTAHYLFVHVSVEPDNSDLSTFARLVPLPDMVIYIRQDETKLIQRTMARGHKRIPSGSNGQVELFIKRAIKTFEILTKIPVVESRLVVVDGERRITNAQDYRKDPQRASVLQIIADGLDVVSAYTPPRNMYIQEAQISKP